MFPPTPPSFRDYVFILAGFSLLPGNPFNPHNFHEYWSGDRGWDSASAGFYCAGLNTRFQGKVPRLLLSPSRRRQRFSPCFRNAWALSMMLSIPFNVSCYFSKTSYSLISCLASLALVKVFLCMYTCSS